MYLKQKLDLKYSLSFPTILIHFKSPEKIDSKKHLNVFPTGGRGGGGRGRRGGRGGRGGGRGRDRDYGDRRARFEGKKTVFGDDDEGEAMEADVKKAGRILT